jgi:hypothetical protein
MVRHHVHAHIHGADYAPEFDCVSHRKFRVATILKDVQGACNTGSCTWYTSFNADAGSGGASSGSPSPFEIN